MGGLLFVLVLVLLASFVQLRRGTAARVERLAGEPIHLTIDDTGLTFVSPDASMRWHWQRMKSVWRYKDQWLIEQSPRERAALPARDLDADARERILAFARANGVSVRGRG